MLLQLPPMGLLAFLLSHGAAGAAASPAQLPSLQNRVPRTAFVDFNLAFVLLAALRGDAVCRCGLSARVRQCGAVFLRLAQDRLDEELNSMRRQGLLTTDAADACAGCDESYRISATGRDVLASRLEEWRLSQLADAALNTQRGEVIMSG